MQTPCHSNPDEAEGFLEDFLGQHSEEVLGILLADRTTGRNIVWADDEHASLGVGFGPDDEMTIGRIAGKHSNNVLPRHAKERERQSLRTKSRAEVFTPSWLVNRMNNHLDAQWFGRADAFNAEDGRGWRASPQPVALPRKKGRGLHAYIGRRVLEVACGEAPFLCSRYDAATGAPIPVGERMGLLDRKLRLASEHARSRGEWTRWALEALRATYGYEYQGDNLLIARINVLLTFCEHCRSRWGEDPADGDVRMAARIVSWNLWQMDGLTCAVPTSAACAQLRAPLSDYTPLAPQQQLQTTLFDFIDGNDPAADAVAVVPLCTIFDWARNEPRTFAALKGSAMGKFFYAVIGNPPYQEENEGNQRKTPIYNYFMDQSFLVGEKVELITPARFLFDAGQTPKEWNRRMLNDSHLKVLLYEPDGSAFFSGPEIKGGVAVTIATNRRDLVLSTPLFPILNSKKFLKR